MGEQTDELIRQMRDFRTRSEAVRELTARGHSAVQPLLHALGAEANEGARWAIVNCLGEIGDGAAVPTVTGYLEDTDYQTVAHDALAKIAGRDLGPLPAPWLRWASEHGHEAPLERDLPDDQLLRKAVEGSGAAPTREAEGRYALELPLDGSRGRKVSVLFGGTDHEGSSIVIVFATCGEARAENYEAALRLNLKMPYGAVALRDIGGAPYFVMFNTILRAGLSPAELRKSILTVGERADRIERRLCN